MAATARPGSVGVIGAGRRGWPVALVLALALAWATFVGSLAEARHASLRTNAFDLGYVAQTLWLTAHGQPFRFTTLEEATFRPEGLDPSTIRRPHSLLAFHVEPVLLLLAPLVGLWSDPRLLLWLQAGVLALGALPAAWLGARVVGSRAAGLAFGAAYLLAPALEGAALSDFHAVALAATWLMAALWCLETGRRRWAVALLALTALAREDAALQVAWLGAVLTLRARLAPAPDQPADLARQSSDRAPTRPTTDRPAPLIWGALALTAGLWAVICFAVIAPYFNGGGSLFWTRYAWLGPTPISVAVGVLGDPWRLLGWLGQPDVISYLALQALAGGLVALLAPVELLALAPLLAMNALSSFDWMRSGGAHYSALLVPLLIWAGAHGAARASRLLRRWRGLGRYATGVVGTVVMLSAALGQAWIGASPLHVGFVWPAVDPRAAAVRAALAAVPPDATVSATSAVYPHLAMRRRAYWYPAGEDAEWLALDVVGTTHPLDARRMRDETIELLALGEHSVVAARDGLLVLRRGRGGIVGGDVLRGAVHAPVDDPSAGRPSDLVARIVGELPDAFFGFARRGDVAAAPVARFGGALELVGHRLRRWPEVGLFGDAGTLELEWRLLQPVAEDLTFALATTRPGDGALVGFQPDAAAGALWYQTSRWQPGEIVHLEMPVERLGRVEALGVAVLGAGGRRLPVVLASGVALPLWENGTILSVERVG